MMDLQNMTNHIENAGYWSGHGYLALVVGVIGILTSLANIAVWWKIRAWKASYSLFLGLSVIDLLTVIAFILYAFYFLCISEPVKEYGHSKRMIYYVLISYDMYVVCYTTSRLMIIALAFFRMMYLYFPNRTEGWWCTVKRAKVLAFFGLPTISLVSYIPFYLYYEVNEVRVNGSDVCVHNETETVYWFTYRFSSVFRHLLLYVYGVVMEILPSLILLGFFISFIVKLFSKDEQPQDREDRGLINSDREGIKMTIMLFLMLLMYVASGLTMGIQAFLFALKTRGSFELLSFMDNAFIHNITDILEMFKCSFNFLVYVCTCNRFKRRLIAMLPFCKRSQNAQEQGYGATDNHVIQVMVDDGNSFQKSFF